MRQLVGPAVALLFAACVKSELSVLDAPWPDDHFVVLVLTDLSGETRTEAPLVFGPSEAIRLELPESGPTQIHLLAYPPETRAPSGKLLTECGVRFSPASVVWPLPDPTEVWVSKAVEPTTEALAFSPASDEDPQRDLYFEECGVAEDLCEGFPLGADLVELPKDLIVGAVELLDEEHALIAASRPGKLDPFVSVITRGQPFETTRSSTLGPEGLVRTLSRAPDGSFYGILTREAAPAELFRVASDGQGVLLDVSELPGSAGPRLLDVGLDGTVLVGTEEQVFEVLSDRVVPRPDFPLPPRRFAVVRNDRILAYNRFALHVFDGEEWTEEHRLSTAEAALELSSLAGDNTFLAAVGELEVVQLRDEETRTWSKLEPPFGAPGALIRLRSVAPAGGGSFVVAGELGHAALYREGRWCPFPNVTLRTLATLRTSPSRQVGVAASLRLDKNVLVWLDHPAPEE